MYRFYLAVVDMLPSAMILLPVYWVLNRVCFHHTKKSILYYLFSCYLSVVYVLVGLPSITYIRPELNLNLLPIIGIIGDWKNSILNILLFVPFGLALPILWKKYGRLRNAVLFGFCLSLTIELLQILTYRTTDINDLITNTTGTLTGFLLAKVLIKHLPKLSAGISEENTYGLKILLTTVLLVMFFIYPFVSSAVWNFIL